MVFYQGTHMPYKDYLLLTKLQEFYSLCRLTTVTERDQENLLEICHVLQQQAQNPTGLALANLNYITNLVNLIQTRYQEEHLKNLAAHHASSPRVPE
jgi:hypothetical protein